MDNKAVIKFLNEKAEAFNQPFFIPNDPISIPHLFSKKQDIEIAAFFAAIFAWGNRTTIINKSKELMQRMHQSPHNFILHHKPKELKNLLDFKHRTFNSTDLLYFIEFLKHHYSRHHTLEKAFIMHGRSSSEMLTGFYHYFFSLSHIPARTKKHIATPEKNATCKRLNMFLRWMVRQDNKGVDFGIWKNISPAQLIIPLDVHVARVARRLGILKRKQTDWQAALELTEFLRTLDKDDPAKYDFALFGLGAIEKF
ncbi:MAG TPA: TIGR02757 family protein [Chitinophagaceae bacterium]|nr:TIGR02757 family protein [Chitinophagaceae bacterium]HND94210.1 TIGR02757 family protein [Chitinophagaceae bacterium]HNF37085.1 TIGR02757 family protein [Chitinophagaceae bacterium]